MQAAKRVTLCVHGMRLESFVQSSLYIERCEVGLIEFDDEATPTMLGMHIYFHLSYQLKKYIYIYADLST